MIKTILDKFTISDISRLMAGVDRKGDCWLWAGAQNGRGYGTFRVSRRFIGSFAVHRSVYALYKGDTSLGLDHLCRNTICANPEHLEPVTQRENVLRGSGVAAKNASKTKCVNGHSLGQDNVYVAKRQPPRGTERICKTCHNLRRKRK